jgi:hypothetical protein
MLDQRNYRNIHPGMHGKRLQDFVQLFQVVCVPDRKIRASADNPEKTAQLSRLNQFMAPCVFGLANFIKPFRRSVARQPYYHLNHEPHRSASLENL